MKRIGAALSRFRALGVTGLNLAILRPLDIGLIFVLMLLGPSACRLTPQLLTTDEPFGEPR